MQGRDNALKAMPCPNILAIYLVIPMPLYHCNMIVYHVQIFWVFFLEFLAFFCIF